MAGVGGYGNCLGLPNIGGEVGFDPTYAGNPLVNALCVGVLPHDRIQLAQAKGPGNQVVLLGAKTGRDGIGGVSVLASATFDDARAPSKRPSVQVGDPFTEKILIECCLEIFDAGPGRRHPGPRRRRPVLRDHARPPDTVTAACRSTSTGCRCARPRCRRSRS